MGLHECTHLLTYLIDQQYVSQIWVNEAVADYFGSSTIEEDGRGKITITPGKIQTDRVLTVQRAIEEGNFIRSFGEGLFSANRTHGLYMAHDDSLLVADDGIHTIQKFNAEGDKLMEIGKRNQPAPA